MTVPSVATTMMSAAVPCVRSRLLCRAGVRTSLGTSLTEFAWRKPQGIDL